MKVKLEEVERYERPMKNRLAFRFGVITVTGGIQAVIRVRISLPDGRTSQGVAAEALAAKWFEKSPDYTDEQNLDQLRQSLDLAIEHYKTFGAATPFGLFTGTYREQRRMLNLLRFLGNELRIPLICLGSHEARDAIRGDAHLNSRFEPWGLPPWRHDADFHGLVGGLLRSLPLRSPSELTDGALKRLIEVNSGVTASIFRMVIDLAVQAVHAGTERITPAAILDHRVAVPPPFVTA